MWQRILQYTDEGFNEIPLNVKEEWVAILSEILDSRVANISHGEAQVQLFVDLEKQKNPQNFFTNVFMNHAAKSLESMFSSDQVNLIQFTILFN